MFILLCILSIFLRFKSDSEWVTRRRNVFTIYDSFRTRRDYIFSISVPVATGFEKSELVIPNEKKRNEVKFFEVKNLISKETFKSLRRFEVFCSLFFLIPLWGDLEGLHSPHTTRFT